jgi:hypothetical protein
VTGMSDLDALFPAPRRIDLLGRQIDLLPASLSRIRHAERVIAIFQECLASPSPVAVLGREAETLAVAVAALTGLPEADLRDLPPQEMPAFMAAINAIVEVNAGFFVTRLLPTLVAGEAKARAAIAGTAGARRSPGLSDGGTAGLN